jgi:hypothetical protein
MLASHSRLSCGPETHFFRWLSNTKPEELLQPEQWPVRAVRFLDSITFSNYRDAERTSVIEKYEIEKARVEKFLSEREPAIAHILASVTVPLMEDFGKSRWIEKTPDHIQDVSEIRKNFPTSPVIQIIRDPRDVTISLMKVPWGARSLLGGLLYWKRLYESSASFFREDPLAYTLKYENLVTCPVDELRRLCQFIGENFEAEMLDTSKSGIKLNSKNVSWKEKASQPLDPSRVSVWRKELSAAENWLAEAFIGDKLVELGYPNEASFERFGEIYPSARLALKYESSMSVFASKNIRFWKYPSEKADHVKIYLGDPAADHWFNGNKFQRILQTTALIFNIMRSDHSKQSIYWVNENWYQRRSLSVTNQLTRLLAPYRVQI